MRYLHVKFNQLFERKKCLSYLHEKNNLLFSRHKLPDINQLPPNNIWRPMIAFLHPKNPSQFLFHSCRPLLITCSPAPPAQASWADQPATAASAVNWLGQ